MADINRPALESAEEAEAPELDPAREFGPTPKTMARARREAGGNTFVALGNYNPDKITFPQMFNMRRDPMIALGLHYIKAPIVNAVWTVESEDPQIAAFAEHALKEIYTPLLLQLLTKLEFGFAAIAKRYTRKVPDWTYLDENGQRQQVWPEENISAVTFNEFRIMAPNQVEPLFTDDGDFNGIKRNDAQEGEDDEIPPEYSLWAINEKEASFGNMYGYPRTGYAFRYWWDYWYRWLLGSRHFEADADPPVKVFHPPGTYTDPDSGQVTDYGDVALAIGQAIRDGATIAIPSDVYERDDGSPTSNRRWDVTFAEGGENMPAFQNAFEYMDVMKLRSIMVPEQALVEGKGGTGARNVAGIHSELFFESQAILMGEIDQIINDFILPDLLQQNFIDPAPARKVTTRFRSEDMTLASEIIKLMANTDPNSLNLNMVELLKAVGLPQLVNNRNEVEETEEEIDTPPVQIGDPPEEEAPPVEDEVEEIPDTEEDDEA